MKYFNHLLSLTVSVACVLASCNGGQADKSGMPYEKTVTISKQVLLDKIKGGWTAQTIGCTYGGPTEFRYRGTTIPDSVELKWYDDYCADVFNNYATLYDDVYMDITFLEVMSRDGYKTPSSSYAQAFANADYFLWHANQAARYNILNGIEAPQSGYWKNNPHADDIDFQIEADFIGMITPGMVNTATEICDTIGHIMNYGDGYYGGVFVATLYSLAYLTEDIPTLINEALKVIPSESKFHQCIADVVRFHAQYPDDWHSCWGEIEKLYSDEKGCPEGVFAPLNIDAAINAAYCVMGLLYGDGDFKRTMEISTRCGQDSDCNPATAAGILGVMIGYDRIPAEWKPAIEKCEDIKFPFTSTSLADAYKITLSIMGEVIKDNGGKEDLDSYIIKVQTPRTVPFEVAFEGLKPVQKQQLNVTLDPEAAWNFNGTAVVLNGYVKKIDQNAPDGYVAQLEAAVDGGVVETYTMPLSYVKRKLEVFYSYDLDPGEHELMVKWLNPDPRYAIQCTELINYENE